MKSVTKCACIIQPVKLQKSAKSIPLEKMGINDTHFYYRSNYANQLYMGVGNYDVTCKLHNALFCNFLFSF